MTLSRYTKYAAIGAVAGIAAYASYSHMQHLALMHGQTPTVAALLPISVDGMLIVATLVMREDRAAGLRVRPWAWASFVIGVAASVTANVLAAADDITSRVISAWPALALLLVIETLATGRKSDRFKRNNVPLDSPRQIAEAVRMSQKQVSDDVKANISTNHLDESLLREAASDLPAETPKPRAPRKRAPRRPVDVTRKLAEEALAAPDVTRTEVAERLDITPRRLRQILNEPSGELPLSSEEVPQVNGHELPA